MMKLSKSVEEYLAAGGWSSHMFFEHAKAVFNDPTIKRTCVMQVGRSVIHIRSQGKMLRAYVHAGGRSREYMTLKDEGGDEVKTFHFRESSQTIIQFLLDYFAGRIE